MDPKQDPATYYAYVFALLEAAREFDQKVFQRDLELPDFTALAMERIGCPERHCIGTRDSQCLSHPVAVWSQL